MKSKIFTATVVFLGSLGLIISTLARDLQRAAPGGRDAAVRPGGALTFADRVGYQRAIEQVYWRHRTWPKERSDPKPSLDQILPPAELAKKVRHDLIDAQLLQDIWQEALTPERLQAEMKRMAQQTRRPEMLREIFAVLENDPAVIAECLVLPSLSRRLLTQRYARDDRFHGDLRRRAEAALQNLHAVEEMRATSGNYREMEWFRSDAGNAEGGGMELNREQFMEQTQSLEGLFPSGDRHSSGTLKKGAISRLQEDDHRYYVIGVIDHDEDHLRLAVIEWLKEPFDSWRAGYESRPLNPSPGTLAEYTLPPVSAPGSECNDDSWRPTLNLPGARHGHTAVWTGSAMIVWGGIFNGPPGYLNSGERYDPATDIWTPISVANAPTAREAPTAVWTGSEMIIWGGSINGSIFDPTGGKYDPVADSWTATSTVNSPPGRQNHTAVWTGNAMIVWGGSRVGQYENTGGRYFPLADTWLPTSLVNAPSARDRHTAIWTGGEMIVWGGLFAEGTSQILDNGAKYDPITDTWVATAQTDAPTRRFAHTAIWSGSRMIVWGGSNGNYVESGGLYDPLTDSWSPTSTAPVSHLGHTAVWTGSEMIIWGGNSPGFSLAAERYHPDTNTWTLSSAFGPQYRVRHTAVWTGTEMIVFGGTNFNVSLNDGGRYNPSSDRWTPTRTTNAPEGRASHTAVWTGSEMIVWGGQGSSSFFSSGGKYDAATDSWMATSASAPAARSHHTAVWTGTEMIVWGGWNNSPFVFYNSGGRYDPVLNRWIPTDSTSAPVARRYHTAVWAGNEMIVWGGDDLPGTHLNTGGRYNPTSNTWIATTTTNAPFGRANHNAVWTGNEMIVWGGLFITGGKYDPLMDRWVAISTVNAPGPIAGNVAVWSGSEMIVWNGFTSAQFVNGGGKYNPTTDSWAAVSPVNQPQPRQVNTAVWTGNEMIVWGGQRNGFLDSGGRYNPMADNWTDTTALNAPAKRSNHTAVWTGDDMVLFGGYDGNFLLNTGARYAAVPAVPVESAASRLAHGSGKNFEVALPQSGEPAIECRSGGLTDDYTLRVTFAVDVSVEGSPQAAVTLGTGSVGSGGVSNGGAISVSGNTVTIPLTQVADAQTIRVTLYCVNGVGNVVISMGRLLGDTNEDGTVSAADIAQVKAASGQAITSANFRADVNANGEINSSDVGQVKARSGANLP